MSDAFDYAQEDKEMQRRIDERRCDKCGFIANLDSGDSWKAEVRDHWCPTPTQQRAATFLTQHGWMVRGGGEYVYKNDVAARLRFHATGFDLHYTGGRVMNFSTLAIRRVLGERGYLVACGPCCPASRYSET